MGTGRSKCAIFRPIWNAIESFRQASGILCDSTIHQNETVITLDRNTHFPEAKQMDYRPGNQTMTQENTFLATPARITGALGYTSELLWHFFGRRKRNYEEKLHLLEIILDKGSLLVDPPGWTESRVQISPAQEVQLDQEAPPTTSEDFYFAEPKMVCLADIPIHCLPIHAQRYKNFAFGFSKQKLSEKYRDALRTVMIFRTEWTLKSLQELEGTLLQRRGVSSVYQPCCDVGKFLKFEHGANTDECFQNIYLEREWRCLIDVELAGTLELIIVPKEVAVKTREIVTRKMPDAEHPVAVLAWESLFGGESEEAQ